MSGYYLVQNLMYNSKHIVKRRWYHKLFGEPTLTVGYTAAVNEKMAEKKFRLKGHHFGMFH